MKRIEAEKAFRQPMPWKYGQYLFNIYTFKKRTRLDEILIEAVKEAVREFPSAYIRYYDPMMPETSRDFSKNGVQGFPALIIKELWEEKTVAVIRGAYTAEQLQEILKDIFSEVKEDEIHRDSAWQQMIEPMSEEDPDADIPEIAETFDFVKEVEEPGMLHCTYLTKEIIEQDEPSFNFAVIDKPFSNDNAHWPSRTECEQGLFIEFGSFIMDEIDSLFHVGRLFDQYDISQYTSKKALRALQCNLYHEMEKFGSWVNVSQFREYFNDSLDYLLKNVNVTENWRGLCDDMIEILRLIGYKAEKCIREGKTLCIIGI